MSLCVCEFLVFWALVVWFVSFVCLFSKERDKERAWSWLGREGAGSGEWEKHDQTVREEKTFSTKRNCVCVGEAFRYGGEMTALWSWLPPSPLL